MSDREVKPGQLWRYRSAHQDADYIVLIVGPSTRFPNDQTRWLTDVACDINGTLVDDEWNRIEETIGDDTVKGWTLYADV